MRLTKSDKEAFILAVMNDVPFIDYDEEARKLFKQRGLDALPADLRPMAVKYPEYFDTHYIYTPGGLGGISGICPPHWYGSGYKTADPEFYALLEEMGQKADDQAVARNQLRAKVRGLIEDCSTLKTAKERLPEFEKYLPQERGVSGVINLPVANTLADLINAGWPKGAEACPS